MDDYITAQAGATTRKPTKRLQGYSNAFRYALDILKDRDMASYNYKDFINFRDTLRLLPPDIYNEEGYKGKTIPQIIELAKSNGVPPRNLKTVNNITGALTALLKWWPERHSISVPIPDLKIKLDVLPENQWKAYSKKTSSVC